MAFLGGDMSNHRVRLFSTAFKEDVVPKKGLRRKMATSDPPGAALASSAPSAEGASASVAELARAKARIEELERLVGRQQLDLDFFRKALRLADALQGPVPARGETNSSRSSKI